MDLAAFYANANGDSIKESSAGEEATIAIGGNEAEADDITQGLNYERFAPPSSDNAAQALRQKTGASIHKASDDALDHSVNTHSCWRDHQVGLLDCDHQTDTQENMNGNAGNEARDGHPAAVETTAVQEEHALAAESTVTTELSVNDQTICVSSRGQAAFSTDDIGETDRKMRREKVVDESIERPEDSRLACTDNPAILISTSSNASVGQIDNENKCKSDTMQVLVGTNNSDHFVLNSEAFSNVIRDSVINNDNEAQNKHHATNTDSEPSTAKESLAGSNKISAANEVESDSHGNPAILISASSHASIGQIATGNNDKSDMMQVLAETNNSNFVQNSEAFSYEAGDSVTNNDNEAQDVLSATNTASEPSIAKESLAGTNCILATSTEPTEKNVINASAAHEVESIATNIAVKEQLLWTCSNCSYNVNPPSNEKCLYCSVDRSAQTDYSMDVEQCAETCKKSRRETNHTGSVSESKCGKSPKKRQRTKEEIILFDSSDSDTNDGNKMMVDNGSTSWHCGRCNSHNTKSKYKCSSCHGWRDGKKPTKSNKKREDTDSDDDLASQEGWACTKCDYFNTENYGNCARCSERNNEPVGKNPEITYSYDEQSSGEDEETYSDDDEENVDKKEKQGTASWTCHKCSLAHSDTATRCSGCRAWKHGKVPRKKVAVASIGWTCIKCNNVNTKSLTKCSDCGGWKDGKRPVKKPIAERPVKLPPVLSKNEYKPLFEKGEPVYAPWWPSGKSNSERTWHPGVIKDYVTLKNGPYGPVRRYNILFDDGDELDDIEDYCIFSKEDYLLSGKQEWIGVANKLDKTSVDMWAKVVGWYEVSIGGEVYVFSKLHEALKAYDDHVGASVKGKNAKRNVPVKINENNVYSTTSDSLKQSPKKVKAGLSKSSSISHVQAEKALRKGVTFNKSNNKYYSYLYKSFTSGKKNHYLGSYVLENDAAWAIDECLRQLGLPAVNFANSSEYSKARRQEVEERGIDLPRSEVQEYIAEKVCVVVSGMIQNEVSPQPSQSTKSCSSQYAGVSFDKATKKYIASLSHNKKSHYLGRFLLGADAAWIHDKCARITCNPNAIVVNFDSESDYEKARDQELAERGLDVPLNEVSQTFKIRFDKFQLAVGTSVDGSCKKEESSKPYHDTEESVNFVLSSPAMNQITAYVSSHAAEPNSATLNAIKTEQQASNPIIPIRSNLITLNPEQTQNLRFPSGTPVWWFVGTDDDEVGMYNDGTVGSVYFEVTSRDLLYEVHSRNQQSKPVFLSEMDLGYAPHCPIFISRCYKNELGSARDLLDRDGDLLQGIVLLCKRVGETWVFTASVRDEAGNTKLLEDIPSNNVLYRNES